MLAEQAVDRARIDASSEGELIDGTDGHRCGGSPTGCLRGFGNAAEVIVRQADRSTYPNVLGYRISPMAEQPGSEDDELAQIRRELVGAEEMSAEREPREEQLRVVGERPVNVGLRPNRTARGPMGLGEELVGNRRYRIDASHYETSTILPTWASVRM